MMVVFVAKEERCTRLLADRDDVAAEVQLKFKSLGGWRARAGAPVLEYH